jgi:hypothetical protein
MEQAIQMTDNSAHEQLRSMAVNPHVWSAETKKNGISAVWV